MKLKIIITILVVLLSIGSVVNNVRAQVTITFGSRPQPVYRYYPAPRYYYGYRPYYRPYYGYRHDNGHHYGYYKHHKNGYYRNWNRGRDFNGTYYRRDFDRNRFHDRGRGHGHHR